VVTETTEASNEEEEVFDLSPEIVNISVTTNEDESVYFRLVDDSATTISSLFSSQGDISIGSEGYISFYPHQNFNGVATINYTITNETSTTTSSLEVVVIAVNDQTTVDNSTGTVNEDTALTVDLTANATDIDGDTLTITSASAANGTIVNGIYTPDADFNGTDTITYVINDSDSATVTVTVNPINDQTTIIDLNLTHSVYEDQERDLEFLPANATDIDGDALTITSASAANGTIVNNRIYTPDANFNGTDTITYVINDSETATLTVTVVAVNDQTTVTNSTASVNEDTVLTVGLTANATDIDGDALTITSASAANGTIANGFYTPDADFNGTDTITYVINDSEPATLTVTVVAVNDQTTVTNSTGAVNEDAELDVDLTANATDIDGDTLTVTSASADNGTIINGIYTPNANFNGTDTITYVINDSESATVTVTVSPINDQTTVNNSTATIDEDAELTVDLTANATDIDGDTLTITSASAANGTIVNGLYIPDVDFNGTDTITYVINDSDSATVTVTVNPINDAPLLSSYYYDTSVLEGSTSGSLVQAVATDVDANSTITYSLSGTGVENFTIDPTTGQISVASSASIDYESDYDPVDRVEPVYNLTITATDEYNAFDTEDIWIDVDDLRGDLTPSFVSLYNGVDSAGSEYVGMFTLGPFPDTSISSKPAEVIVDPIFTDGLITKINYYSNYPTTTLIGYSLKVADTYDRTGSYELDNSTVYWDYWNNSTFTEISDGVSTTMPELSLTILEDNPNDSLSLPTVGVLNYEIAEASPVMYGVCITCNDAVTYGTLNSADLYINFYDNNIGAQFTVTSPTGTVTTSDFITAVLIQQTGQFFGQTGLMNFNKFSEANNTLEYDFNDFESVTLNEGNAVMQGTMMGNSGSHVGVVYGISVSDNIDDVAIGAVLFAAIENINLNMTVFQHRRIQQLSRWLIPPIVVI